MNFKVKLDFDDLINHSTIIYGETNTYKTHQTAEFVKFLLESKNIAPKDISILDFAPSLITIKNLKVGGKIQDFYKQSDTCNNIIFKGEIIPPRLKSSNKKELFGFAQENFKKTSEILKIFDENPTKILIINDISIYLHIGGMKLLLNAINKSKTFFGNAYFGSSIKRGYATLFSLQERRKVKSLVKKVEQSYFTG